MKKKLNKLAVWLYKKTKEENIKTPHEILSGLQVVESRLIPKGKCFIGTGEKLPFSFLNQEICLKKENLNSK